jgi:phosphotransacetylase
MMEQVGGYKAIGPILTGFAYPGWSDLSRGTTIETIMDMAYVTAIRGLKK